MKRTFAILYLSAVAWVPGQDLPGPALAAETPVQGPVKVLEPPEDAQIERRLAGVLAQIEAFADVKVEIRSGVATLSGEVPNARSTREILEIARQTEGVVYVQNQLEEEVDVKSRLRPTTRRFREVGTATLRILPVALIALAVVALFWFLGQWAGNRGKWLRHLGLSELAASLGRRIIRTVITGIGIVIALEILDATAVVGALLGVAGVAGIALGFAFRNIVENYLAGVLLSARNPFESGDEVKVGEFLGKVVRLTSRDTVLMTLDGNHLRVPNSIIITSAMTNFSRNPLRRFEFVVGISTDFEILPARDLGITTLARMKGVLPDPKPQGLVAELGESTVQLKFLAWIDQRETDFRKARSEGIRLVKSAFDGGGIEMPEPIYRVHLRDSTRATHEDRPPPERHDPTECEQADVATDRSIDDQVASELQNSEEENLLGKAGGEAG